MKRIGIFGGSFDPPHQAHVELARTALRALSLDEVRWIPAGQPWQKLAPARAMTPAGHREAMVRLAIAGEPGFVLDRIEIEREGPSLTLDTVVAFQAAEPGADDRESSQKGGGGSRRQGWWRGCGHRIILAEGRPGRQ